MTRCLNCKLFATVAILFACQLSSAFAQQRNSSPTDNYPNKPVRILVGNAPGGGSDITARAVAQKLTEQWNGHSVIVENRAGASGIIAFDSVARAAPDGYLLLVASSSSLASAQAQRKLAFDIRKDYEAITQLTSQSMLVLAIPTLPANTVAELVALAKARPGALNLGSSGAGSIAHAALELFNSLASIEIAHIPYKGIGPALTAILGGELPLAIATPVSGQPFIKTGKLKAIASTGAKRERALPDLPTFSESGVPLELDDWFGAYTTGGSPAGVVSFLHRDITRALASPDVQNRLGGADAAPSPTPADARQKIAGDIVRWEKIIKIPRFANSLQ